MDKNLYSDSLTGEIYNSAKTKLQNCIDSDTDYCIVTI